MAVHSFGSVGFANAPFAHCDVSIVAVGIRLPPKSASLKYVFAYAKNLGLNCVSDLNCNEKYAGISLWECRQRARDGELFMLFAHFRAENAKKKRKKPK